MKNCEEVSRIAPRAVWSAAACCRFACASLLALHLSGRVPLCGQQAGLGESGGKLPHSRPFATTGFKETTGILRPQKPRASE